MDDPECWAVQTVGEGEVDWAFFRRHFIRFMTRYVAGAAPAPPGTGWLLST